MIYLVSGFMRSGTSMMMKALAEGGMDTAYSRARDERLNARFGEPDKPNGYQPNSQYYELDARDYRDPRFPQPFEGKLVKCLWGGIGQIGKGEYRCVFMRRPRKDIAMSCLAAFGRVPEQAQAHDFDMRMERVVSVLNDRRSFLSVDEVWYDDVLDEPLTVFRQLQWNGWPIDPYLAANVPTKARKRYAA